MKATEIYTYLNKVGLADQVHLRKGNQMVFYHWNRAMTELIPSLTIQDNRIEKMYYARAFMPKIYAFVNLEVENDFTNQQFLRDYRDV